MSLHTVRTLWATTASSASSGRLSAAAAASSVCSKKPAAPHAASPSTSASYYGAALSAKSTYVGLPSFQQKRFFASPVTIVDADYSVTSPPAVQSAYKKTLLVPWLQKNIVTDYLLNLSASADVLALAKVELDLSAIPEGKNVVLKWRGKPIFVRHRTADEIAEANTVNMDELRHRETDSDRTQKPEWLVMLGVCTHLGCVPLGEAGEYGGWFCPCHGSHYDISGRIRKGPAPLNMEIPPYEIKEGEDKLIIG
ncbi:cytochrome b-c1 complex subunit Rieske, mitochondrial [Batrachochytrium salamandrivorans]|nr:cytochrome b-c1 complex subunit Rieske, mitochondrial [Batrachochytrium salamandrivorans]